MEGMRDFSPEQKQGSNISLGVDFKKKLLPL